jgi:hypothetical protein
MTIMYCQSCHSVSECRVESPQPATRTLYFENPYMNVYVRARTCEKCGESFKTYEIGEASFKAMRKCVEMSAALGDFIADTWASTRAEFQENRAALAAQESEEEHSFEDSIKKEPSYLGGNVVSIFKNKEGN